MKTFNRLIFILFTWMVLLSAYGQNSGIQGHLTLGDQTEALAGFPVALFDERGEPFDTAFTNIEGVYQFDGLPDAVLFFVQPLAEPIEGIDWRRGVSALDLVNIKKYLLENGSPSAPFELIAADVNGTNSITAADLLLTLRLILQVDDQLPIGQSWRFVRSDWTFDPEEVLKNLEQAGQIQILTNGSLQVADFKGIKLGDTNFDVLTIE